MQGFLSLQQYTFSLLFCFNVFIDCSGDFDLDVVFFSTCCLLIGHQFLMLSSFQMWQDIGSNYGHNYCRKILSTHILHTHEKRHTTKNSKRCTYKKQKYTNTKEHMNTETQPQKCILSIILGLLKTQLQNAF